jgi:hypothetical protein
MVSTKKLPIGIYEYRVEQEPYTELPSEGYEQGYALPHWSDREFGRMSEILPDKHGTLSSYINGRCRCELCRAAKHDYYQRRKAS